MRLDERGKQCPLPVIEAKKALESSAPGEKVEVVVDNEIAVQNLTKMADHKGFAVCSERQVSVNFWLPLLQVKEMEKQLRHQRQQRK